MSSGFTQVGILGGQWKRRPVTRRRTIMVDLAVGAMLVFAGIPFYYSLDWRIAGVPVLNAIFLGTMILVAVRYVIQPPVDRRLLTAYLASAVWLVLISTLYRVEPTFDARSALQDVITFLGLPAGIALAQVKWRSGFTEALPRWLASVCVVFAVSILGLYSGYLPSKTEVRLVDPALFSSAFIIPVFFPAMWSCPGEAQKVRRAIGLLGVVLCGIYSELSATRSIFITLVFSLLCTAVIEAKRDRRYLVWLGAGFLMISGLFLASNLPGLLPQSLLLSRMESTEVSSEDRFEELTWMLEQMGPAEWIHGTGFGTSFLTPIETDFGTGYALAPHVGLGAMLYKGGLLGFLGLMLVPCLVAIFRLLFRTSSGTDPFLAGVAIFLVQSCLSGGWGFLPLFLAGSCLQLGLNQGDFRTTGVPDALRGPAVRRK